MKINSWGIGIYHVLVICIAILFSGSGSVAERIKYKFDDPSSIDTILFILILIGIAFYHSIKEKKNNHTNKTPKIIYISYKIRITYFIIGLIFLLIGIVEVIWNFIPYATYYYYFAIALFFGFGVTGWKTALYDPYQKKMNWNMLKKSDVVDNEKINKTLPKIRGGKLFYFFALTGIISLIISILIKIFITSKPADVFIEIISIILITVVTIYVKVNENKNKQ